MPIEETRTVVSRGSFIEKYLYRGAAGSFCFKGVTWNTFLNDLAGKLQQLQITSFVGGKVETGAAGTALEAEPGGGGSAAAALQPFQMISFVPVGGDMTGDSGYTLTLQPGIINGAIFPEVSGVPMWQLQVMTSALPTLTVMKGDTVYIQGTVAAGGLTNANIYSGTVPTQTDELTVYILGTCDPTTGKWTQVSTGNLAYAAQAAYFDAGSRLVNHVWEPVTDPYDPYA